MRGELKRGVLFCVFRLLHDIREARVLRLQEQAKFRQGRADEPVMLGSALAVPAAVAAVAAAAAAAAVAVSGLVAGSVGEFVRDEVLCRGRGSLNIRFAVQFLLCRRRRRIQSILLLLFSFFTAAAKAGKGAKRFFVFFLVDLDTGT